MKDEPIRDYSPIPPCQDACPVNTRARDYVRAIAFNRLEEAYRIITENNPFPSACGRICMHPCEEACRRNQVDEPISIASLKRHAADFINENKLFLDRLSVAKSGKRVAIIGAGPSGLAAAVKLAEAGHEVNVFERDKKAGGMLRYGIPNYRLEDRDLDEDIKRIEAKGVNINTSKAVGEDINLDKLKEEYDAVLIAVGLSNSRTLPIEGIDAKGVYLAIPFLKACNKGEKVDIGNNVLIIGGGNVAIDVARTARRLNTKAKVTIACLESSTEMPASPWEIKETLEENISIKNCMGPRKIDQENGYVKGMNFITCASVFDKEGRFNPSFKEDEKHYVEVDTIIVTIGQQANLSFLPDNLVRGGRLIFSNDTLAVTDDGVFASGEVAKGPGSAISAIAHGNQAAEAINKYLAAEAISLGSKKAKVVGELSVAEKIVKIARAQNKFVEASKRINNFDQFDEGLNDKDAVVEALRCMDCGSGAVVNQEKCASCLTCVRVCPFGVASIDKQTGVAVMPAEGCQACGACASMCPATAIEIKAYPINDSKKQIKQVFKDKKSRTIGFVCQAEDDIDYEDSHIIRVKCSIRITDSTFLEAFASGAQKVFVVCHELGRCRYYRGGEYTRGRISHIKKILDDIGIGGSSLEIFNKSDREAVFAFLKGEKILSAKS